VGNIAFYDNNVPYEVIRINSEMVLLRGFSVLIKPDYFIHLVRHFNLLENFLSGSAQPQMPISTMKNIVIALPALEIQNEFVNFIKFTDKRKIKLQRSLEALKLLYQSLMQKYFNEEMF